MSPNSPNSAKVCTNIDNQIDRGRQGQSQWASSKVSCTQKTAHCYQPFFEITTSYYKENVQRYTVHVNFHKTGE